MVFGTTWYGRTTIGIIKNDVIFGLKEKKQQPRQVFSSGRVEEFKKVHRGANKSILLLASNLFPHTCRTCSNNDKEVKRPEGAE